MENIIISVNKFHFKNPSLQKASQEIASRGKEINRLTHEIEVQAGDIGKSLAWIKQNEAYKDDGFKSLAEYAEKTFDIKESLCYQLARAGERFLLADSPTAVQVSAMLTTSNMAELTGLTDAEIQAGIDAGKVTGETTQADLRRFAKEVKAAREVKPKVAATYYGFGDIATTAFPSGETTLERFTIDKATPATMEALEELYGTHKTLLPEADNVPAVVLFWSDDGSKFGRFYLTKYKAPKATKGGRKSSPAKTIITPEQAASLTPEEKAALLKVLGF